MDTTESILANKELMKGIEEGLASMQQGGEHLTYEEVFGMDEHWEWDDNYEGGDIWDFIRFIGGWKEVIG